MEAEAGSHELGWTADYSLSSSRCPQACLAGLARWLSLTTCACCAGKGTPRTRKRRKTSSPEKSGAEDSAENSSFKPLLKAKPRFAQVPPEVKAVRKAVHQFGVVGGEDYDSKVPLAELA